MFDDDLKWVPVSVDDLQDKIRNLEDNYRELDEEHIELCEKIHELSDDIPNSVMEKIRDLVYARYEP